MREVFSDSFPVAGSQGGTRPGQALLGALFLVSGLVKVPRLLLGVLAATPPPAAIRGLGGRMPAQTFPTHRTLP